MPKHDKSQPPMPVESISQADLPHGRNGKHKQVVTQLLQNLSDLPKGQALKIRLTELPDTKENIRSALNRAIRQRDMQVATSTDANYLYVWAPEAEPAIE